MTRIVETGDRVGDRIPEVDVENPADLEAWYGNFGFCEAFRTVCLANCKEIVRAQFAVLGQKISEERIKDLAHTHSSYLDFLTTHLNGRRLREASVKESARYGA